MEGYEHLELPNKSFRNLRHLEEGFGKTINRRGKSCFYKTLEGKRQDLKDQ